MSTTFRPVCSTGGRIEKLLLFHPCTASEQPGQVWKQYAGLMEALGREVEYYIVLQLPGAHAGAVIPQPAPHVHLVPFPQGEGLFTRWTQDVVHAFQRSTGDGTELRLVYDAHRIDARAVRHLSENIPGLRVRSLNDPLSGGNILNWGGGNGYLLAGADLLRHRLRGLPPAEKKTVRQAFERELKELFGTERLYWLNRTSESGALQGAQPLFHADLYVTPLGPVSPGSETQQVLVAELKEEYAFRPWNREMEALSAALDRTAAWLENSRLHKGLSCKVERIPMLVFDQRREHFGSYNNSLVSCEDGRRTLYLPDFTPPEGACAVLARRITEIQRSITARLEKSAAGEVKWVQGDFYNLSLKKGALRCMAKVIQRSAA